ncbi:MAG TPA: hypothetical protein VJ731_13230, partial [Terriglobales bacterium]|nr:hypothetical protein [Terriglobales bacterium]
LHFLKKLNKLRVLKSFRGCTGRLDAAPFNVVDSGMTSAAKAGLISAFSGATKVVPFPCVLELPRRRGAG